MNSDFLGFHINVMLVHWSFQLFTPPDAVDEDNK